MGLPANSGAKTIETYAPSSGGSPLTSASCLPTREQDPLITGTAPSVTTRADPIRDRDAPPRHIFDEIATQSPRRQSTGTARAARIPFVEIGHAAPLMLRGSEIRVIPAKIVRGAAT